MKKEITTTSLSGGKFIFNRLSEELADNVTAIHPVSAPETTLPCITYRRNNFSAVGAKTGRSADTVKVEVVCHDATHTGSINLAERVRHALEGVSGFVDGVNVRSCVLADSSEDRSADAYLQKLFFEIKC